MKVTVEGAKDTYKQVPISVKDGTPNFSFRVFTIEPGGNTPFHAHPFEHINYIIEGKGIVLSERGAERPVEKGDFAFVLPNEIHQYINTDKTQNLVMICAVPKEHE